MISVPLHGGILDPYLVVLLKEYIFTIRMVPQLWRLVTPFFITGPKLSIILDLYFIWTYGSALETTSPSFSQGGDFFIYLVFVAVIILVRLSFSQAFVRYFQHYATVLCYDVLSNLQSARTA